MIKVGIIGANGYLGVELIRILSVHPKVKLLKINDDRLPSYLVENREKYSLWFDNEN